MEIIVRGRCLGKTETLIRKSSETGYYIVAINHKLAKEIDFRARELGLKIPFPITHLEFLKSKFYGLQIGGFLIDDVDILLLQLSRGVPIAAVTLGR